MITPTISKSTNGGIRIASGLAYDNTVKDTGEFNCNIPPLAGRAGVIIQEGVVKMLHFIVYNKYVSKTIYLIGFYANASNSVFLAAW